MDLDHISDMQCIVSINRTLSISNPLLQEYSDDEEERRVKRAENAKRKAASAAAASDGEVVAVESDDSRQGAITRRTMKLHQFS